MFQNTQRIIFVVIGLVVGCGVLLFFIWSKGYIPFQGTSQEITRDSSAKSPVSASSEDPLMLEGYPSDVVPLFQLNSIEAMKYFMNDDPANFAGYFGKDKQYFNVVYSTNAQKSEVFAYYRGIMTQENLENTNPDMIEGKIGTYGISVSQYEDDTVYIQVHDDSGNTYETNPYYGSYPEIVAIHSSWIEHENSYGRMAQNNGTEEFTQYFVINEEILDDEAKKDSMQFMYEEYEKKYSAKDSFTTDSESGLMSWVEGAHRVTLSFSKDHDRIYLMIRKPLSSPDK